VQERLRQAEQQRAAAEARAEEAKVTAQAQRRARQRTVALVGVVTAGVLLGGGAGAWYWQERTQRRMEVEREAEVALQEARARLAQQEELERRNPERWAEVLAIAEGALQRAEAAVVSVAVNGEVVERVRQLRDELAPKVRDSRLRLELDRIRLERAPQKQGPYRREALVPRYRAALEEYGIGISDARAAGEFVRSSRLRSELLAALRDWGLCSLDAEERQQLRAVLAAADPEAEGTWKRWWEAVQSKEGVRLTLARELASGMAAADLVNLAEDLRVRQQAKAAEQVLREARRRFPEDFWINHDLGMVLDQQVPPQREEAVRYLAVAVALRSESAGAHLNLGNALQMQGKLAEAIDEYQKAIALDPKYVLAHSNLGSALYKQGKPAEAIKAYHDAIALDPKYAPTYTGLGVVLWKQGKRAEAIEAHSRAIALDQKYALPHFNLGNALQAQGKLAEASDEYQKAIALDPSSALAHNNLGNTLKAQEKLREAIEEYRQAIRLDPRSGVPHYNLGAALQEQRKHAEAIDEYRKAIALDDKNALAHLNLGTALQVQGKLVEAIEEYRQAVALDPKDASARFYLGTALKAQGKLAEAIEEYHQAIVLDPKDATAHLNLGAALEKQGKLPEGIDEYRKAIALDANLAHAHGALGQALLAQGKFAEAQQPIRRCLVLLPPMHPMRGSVTQQLRYCEDALALDAKLPAILRGDAHPVSTAETIALAQLCQQFKQMPTTAARFYSDAFAAERKLAADLTAQHRYNAACSAALAAVGQGKDADKLDLKERQRLRRQALDWLRADLDGWSKRLAEDAGKDKEAIHKILEHWQKDTDLASVREEKALAVLTAEERDAWKKLWANVAALLDKAKGPR
jgi:superkiller protein 3